jgi:hypothetical protein
MTMCFILSILHIFCFLLAFYTINLKCSVDNNYGMTAFVVKDLAFGKTVVNVLVIVKPVADIWTPQEVARYMLLYSRMEVGLHHGAHTEFLPSRIC